MIVIVGTPAWRAAEPASPAGRACEIALVAAARGAGVELVGRVGDDPAGDALMLGLRRSGVGHVALLRDPTRPTRIVEPPAEQAEPSLLGDDDPVSAATAPVSDATLPRLDPADVELGLQYLTTFTVIVVTDDVAAEVLPVVTDAAAFAGAHLVLLVGEGSDAPAGAPSSATILQVPFDDPGGAFSALVGAYAAALDDGRGPAEAFVVAVGNTWESPAS